MKKSFILALCFLTTATIVTAQNRTADKQQFASLGDFKLESGGVIKDCRIGYRTYGHLNAAKTNGILFPTWFHGTSKEIELYATPWKAIDTTKYFLILADSFGDGVSSSPSNSVKQHGADFPAFTIKDMVESEYQFLTKSLAVNHLHAVMGISMGGFQTFQWAVSYPAFMDHLIPIVGSPQMNSFDLLNANIGCKIIEADTGFHHGRYKVNPVIAAGTMLLEINFTTPAYRVKTMSRDGVAGYVRTSEAGQSKDWNDQYYQLKACMGQDISKQYNGSLKEAASHIQAKMLIIASQQDRTVSPGPAIEFSKLLPARLLVLDTELGHLAWIYFGDAALKKGVADELADGQ